MVSADCISACCVRETVSCDGTISKAYLCYNKNRYGKMRQSLRSNNNNILYESVNPKSHICIFLLFFTKQIENGVDL